jgi:L-threonylcarbamoyladenylate synthase
MAEAFGFCVTATSANVSGRPPARRPAEIDAEVVVRVDLVIDGVTPGGEPSTIVDLTAEAPRLVRAGAIAWERVLESLQ